MPGFKDYLESDMPLVDFIQFYEDLADVVEQSRKQMKKDGG